MRINPFDPVQLFLPFDGVIECFNLQWHCAIGVGDRGNRHFLNNYESLKEVSTAQTRSGNRAYYPEEHR